MKVFDLELPGARVHFSTRQGGVSESPYDTLNLGILTGDERGAVVENRRRLADRVGVPPERVAMGWQVHGAEVREWEEPVASRFADPDADLARVDGHTTTAEGLALLVLVADCLPVALSGGGRVAMLHCGWRGLAAGIVERAVGEFDGQPAAAVGPGIGACCYEVGEEVLEAFADLDGVAEGRMLDLRAVARAKLERCGIGQPREVDLCTSCNPDLFFSHRRDGPETGRQAGVVVRTA
jgi:purine-nucleoside/S-methyl-5'-thioadenosine phosphorylase / adenosine deaminase